MTAPPFFRPPVSVRRLFFSSPVFFFSFSSLPRLGPPHLFPRTGLSGKCSKSVFFFCSSRPPLLSPSPPPPPKLNFEKVFFFFITFGHQANTPGAPPLFFPHFPPNPAKKRFLKSRSFLFPFSPKKKKWEHVSRPWFTPGNAFKKGPPAPPCPSFFREFILLGEMRPGAGGPSTLESPARGPPPPPFAAPPEKKKKKKKKCFFVFNRFGAGNRFCLCVFAQKFFPPPGEAGPRKGILVYAENQVSPVVVAPS